jgi:hypothetical protein
MEQAMARKEIAVSTLIEILIQGTAKVLRRDASFLGKQIEIRRRDGGKDGPNWDANVGIAAPIVLTAFSASLKDAQAKYDLDPPR